MFEITNINLKIHNTELFDGSFYANVGQVTMINGPIGSGKTTFFENILEIKLKIKINNKKIIKDEQWFRQVSYVNQDVHLYDDFTFQELSRCFKYDSQINFEDIGITYFPDKKITLCSEGEKQRICLLVGLWKKPFVLILDEPTSFLDRKNQDKVMTLIKDYTKENHCITIISSHHTYDQQYADRCYEIENKGLKLKFKSDKTLAEVRKIKKGCFDLSYLIHFLKKSVYKPMILILGSLLLSLIIFLGVTLIKLEDTRNSWLNSKERYYLSYTESANSHPLYFYSELIEINGNIIPIGVMNYYENMNMFTQNIQGKKDIIATEALYNELSNNIITINNQTYQITNVMKENENKKLREMRYMIYIPDELFPMKSQGELLYYTLTYSNEDELRDIVENIKKDSNFINENIPLQDYITLQNQLKGYRLMLSVIPLILGCIIILIRIILERKYHSKIELLRYNGFSKYENIKLQIKLKIIPLLLSTIIILVSFFNKEIPVYAGFTILVYLTCEFKLSFFGYNVDI